MPTTSASAGINKVINFQGKVTNSNGTNVTDGTYDFTFKLYDGAGSAATTLFTETWSSAALFSSTMSSAPASGGESLTYSSDTNESTLKPGQILWNTTKKESVKIVAINTSTNVITISPTKQAWATSDTITNKIYVKSGLFTVAINALNQDLSGVDFNSDSIYLGVNFNADGEMKPRIQFAAVPYAFNSEKVNGLAVTNTSGNPVATGTTLKIADNKTVTFNNGLAFSGTDGKTINFGGNNITFTTSGDTSLTLPTSGTVCVSGGTCSLGSSTNAFINNGNAFGGLATLGTTDNNDLRFLTNNTEAMRILASGNVGISTASPTAQLQINGRNDVALTGTVAATNGSGNIVGTGTSFTTQLKPNQAIKIAGITYSVYSITDDTHLSLYTAYSGTTASGLSATTDPSTMLAINSGDNKNILNLSNSGVMQLGSTNGNAQVQVSNIIQSTLGGVQSSVSNNGLVFISRLQNDTPDYGYQPGLVWATSDNNPTKPKAGIWTQDTASGSYLAMGTSYNYATGINNQAITIDPNGNVGINNANPSGVSLSVGGTGASSRIIQIGYTTANTLGSDLTGINMDLTTNVTQNNKNITGLRFTPPLTNTFTNTSGTVKDIGLSIGDSSLGLQSAFTMNGSGGSAEFDGFDVTTPNITQTAGTITANGVKVTTGSITTGGTQNGINIVASGVGAGTLNGLNISSITGGSGTETGIAVGSGWDYAATFQGNVGIGTTTPTTALEVVGDVTSKGTKWTSRTSAYDNNWTGVTYGNGLFVAVADSGIGSGNRIMTSSDGINWTTRTSPVDNAWNSVVYGNGLFVAVAYSGTGNRVMTSPDGINWTVRTSAADNSWTSVTYGNGMFVAVATTGTGNRVMTSPDGINWTVRTSAADNQWNSVTYGNGLFVAVAQAATGNGVMTSPDGITWTSRTSGADSDWQSVTYGNGLFVATAWSSFTGQLVMTSPDGINWTARATPGTQWYGITYGNGLFVTVTSAGTGNRVMTSPDGVNWTVRASAANNNWYGVTYGNGLFVAVASSGTGNRVMTSGRAETNALSTNNLYQGGMSINGNLGLGTTAPNYTFDINSNSTTNNRGINLAQSGTKTSADYGAYIANTSTSSTASINKYGLYLSSTGTWNGTSANNYGLYVDTPTGGTNNYAAVFAGGKVGIGTTTPGSLLEVKSFTVDPTVAINADMASGGVASLSFQDNGIQSTSVSGDSNGLHLNGIGSAINLINSMTQVVNFGAKTATNYGLSIQNTATSSTNSIDKYGLLVSSTGTWNGASANNYGLYVTQPTGGTNNYAAVFAGGNVGIGTTAPTEKLDIEGGNLLIGSQSDATSSFTNINASTTAGSFGSETSVDGVFSSAVYNGKLYIATKEPNASNIYRYDGSNTWTKVNDSSGKIIAGDTANINASILTVFNGKLYAGTQTSGTTGAVYQYDGSTWTLINGTRGTFASSANVPGVSDMVVYNNQFWVITKTTNASLVYIWVGGTTFQAYAGGTIGAPCSGDAANADGGVFTVYNNTLYLGVQSGSGTGKARLCVYTGGNFTLVNSVAGTFSGVAAYDDVTSLAIYNNMMFIGLGKATAAAIDYFEIPPNGGTGDNFAQTTSTAGRIDATNDATDINSVPTMRVYNGRLYAGSATTTGKGAIYEWTGPVTGNTNQWTIVNATRGTFGSQTSVNQVDTLMDFSGNLYVGTEQSNAGSIYTWSKTSGNSYALKLTGGSTTGAISFVNQDTTGNSKTSGAFLFSNTIQTANGAYDLAEDYPTSDSTLGAGDVVAIDPSQAGYVQKSSGAYNPQVLGIYSANPGFRLSQNGTTINGARAIPVALTGRVPVNVSTENGPITSGDYLTTSSQPGVAMKMTRPGQSVGRALDNYTGTITGKVLAFVSATYVDPTATNQTDATETYISSQSLKPGDAVATANDGNPQAVIKTDSSYQSTAVGIVSQLISTSSATDNFHTHAYKLALNGRTTLSISAANGSITAGDFLTTSNTPGVAMKATKPGVAIARALENYSNSETGTITAIVNATFYNPAAATTPTSDNLSTALQVGQNQLTTDLDLKVMGKITAVGGLTVGGPAEFQGPAIFRQLADFFDNVVFHKDVQIDGHLTLNQDAAGYATIHKGDQQVTVTFSKPYATTPIIVANPVAPQVDQTNLATYVTNNQCDNNDTVTSCQDKLDQLALHSTVTYIVTSKSATGFTIKLPTSATTDQNFSWTVIAINNPTTFQSTSAASAAQN